MTKQVQISCNFAQGQFGVGDYWVTITPELARKIVALAKLPAAKKPKREQVQRDAKFIRDTAEACKHFKLAEARWYERMLAIADRLEKQQ